jgi:hypothetical protein
VGIFITKEYNMKIIITEHQSKLLRRVISENNDQLVDNISDELLKKSYIIQINPNDSYTSFDPHPTLKSRSNFDYQEFFKEEYGIDDLQTQLDIISRAKQFIYFLNTDYDFVFNHKLPYFEPYPISLYDIKKHINDLDKNDY